MISTGLNPKWIMEGDKSCMRRIVICPAAHNHVGAWNSGQVQVTFRHILLCGTNLLISTTTTTKRCLKRNSELGVVYVEVKTWGLKKEWGPQVCVNVYETEGGCVPRLPLDFRKEEMLQEMHRTVRLCWPEPLLHRVEHCDFHPVTHIHWCFNKGKLRVGFMT